MVSSRRFDELIGAVVASAYTGLDTEERAGAALIENVRFNRAVLAGELVPPAGFEDLMGELERAVDALDASWEEYARFAEASTDGQWRTDPRRDAVDDALDLVTGTLRRLLRDTQVRS